MQKHLLVISIIGIIFIIGCASIKTGYEPAISPVPTARVNLEATILSLHLDYNDDCAEKCPGTQYPKDYAIVRLDSIEVIEDPENIIKWKVGDEITANFAYSARPAKLLRDPQLDVTLEQNPNAVASYEIPLSKPIPIENGYFIYYSQISKEKETTLSGLKVGNKFRASISAIKFRFNPENVEIGQYTIIS